jgi:dimethylargininase
MHLAMTRAVPDSMADCELTFLERVPIDVARASHEHEQYEALLRSSGCRVERLPPEPALPDSVFVEDAAVVFDEIAIIARPGAPSRRPEVTTVAAALAAHRTLHHIDAPGTLDGGDILVAGRRVFAGISQRTTLDGIRQLEAALRPYGYEVTAIHVGGCLHLKSAATTLPDGRLLISPALIDAERFGLPFITVDPSEPEAANVLHLDGTVIGAAHAPRTLDRLAREGFAVVAAPVGELAKAEAGVTCCSLILNPTRPAPH